MIDNMQGLYKTTTEAFNGGMASGAALAFRHIMQDLSGVSSKHEAAGDVASFRAAEECCAAVLRVKQAMEGQS